MSKLPKPEKRLFYNNDDSAKSYIFAIVLPYIIAFVVSMILSAIAKGDSEQLTAMASSPAYLICASFIAPLTFLLIVLLYTKAFNISLKATNIHKKLSWKDSLITLIVVLVVFFGLSMFMECHNEFLTSVLHFNREVTVLPSSNIGWLVLQIFLMAVLPAVCEEFLFRGLIFQGLRKNFSDKLAIILSALMFALMHGSLDQLVYPFLLGLVFGWLVLRTGSLWASVIVHFLNNTFVLIFNYLSINYAFNPFKFDGQWWYILVAFVVLAVAAVILYLIDKFYFNKKNKNEIEKELAYRPSAFLWLGLGVAGIIFVLNLITTYI